MKVHVILTGGTIGSSLRTDGTLAPTDLGKLARGKGESITYSSPYTILSENLTPHRWNKLISHFRSLDLSDMDAVFITHGTDTLAYTANLLALLLHGFDKPVFLIAANLPFSAEGSNGPANFKAALAAADGGVENGVYVPWKHPSAPGEANLLKAETLLQSADFSNTFRVVTDPAFNNLNRLAARVRSELTNKAGRRKPFFPEEFNHNAPLVNLAPTLLANVLAIRPYPGIRYDGYDLSHVTTILHGTYHTFTAADTEEAPWSLTAFAAAAKTQGVPLYMAPLPSNPEKRYASIKRIIDTGEVIPLPDTSFEMAFALLTILFSRFTLDLE
jgi:L-asparaginase